MEQITFTEELEEIKLRADVAADIFGEYGLKRLEDSYDWNIEWHEKNGDPEDVEQYKRKKELLAEAKSRIEFALRGFFESTRERWYK